MDNEQLLLAMSDMMDKKLDEKLQPINSRLDNVDKRLDNVDKRLDNVDKRLDNVDKRLDNVDKRLDNVDSRIEKLESDVSALRVGQVSIRKELKEVNHRVTDTYDLALDAWGTTTENRNWLEKSKAEA